MKWIVIIALVAAGLWWAYNNTDFGRSVDSATETVKQKSLIDTVNQSRSNRINAVNEAISQ